MYNLFKVILVTSLISFSCSEPGSTEAQNEDDKGKIMSKVMVPAGEMYDDFSRLKIPTFFNVGTVEHKKESEVVIKSIILGERLEKGKSVKVKPIALFSFNQDSLDHKFLVTSYQTSENEHLSSDFNAFMSLNNELQLSIENWYRAQCGFSSCNSYTWNDTYRAFLSMD